MRTTALLACAVILTAAAPEQSHVNIVFDGDSIAASVGASPPYRLDTLAAVSLGPDAVRLHNVSASGRPVSDCLRLYPTLVAPLFDATERANVIVFHAGDNDVNRDHSADQIYNDLASYIAKAHVQGWRVIVSTELYRPDFPANKEAQLEAYNRLVLANSAGADAVVDFNKNPLMTNLVNRTKPSLFHDRLHPSDGGYLILAGMINPVLAQVIAR